MNLDFLNTENFDTIREEWLENFKAEIAQIIDDRDYALYDASQWKKSTQNTIDAVLARVRDEVSLKVDHEDPLRSNSPLRHWQSKGIHLAKLEAGHLITTHLNAIRLQLGGIPRYAGVNSLSKSTDPGAPMKLVAPLIGSSPAILRAYKAARRDRYSYIHFWNAAVSAVCSAVFLTAYYPRLVDLGYAPQIPALDLVNITEHKSTFYGGRLEDVIARQFTRVLDAYAFCKEYATEERGSLIWLREFLKIYPNTMPLSANVDSGDKARAMSAGQLMSLTPQQQAQVVGDLLGRNYPHVVPNELECEVKSEVQGWWIRDAIDYWIRCDATFPADGEFIAELRSQYFPDD